MAFNEKKEVWLRGPVKDIIPALQPVAHALLQAREELNELMDDFDEELLWKKPGGAASPGFHLQHMTGVLDRLFTYAKGQQLTAFQLGQLAAEGSATADGSVGYYVRAFNEQVDKSLERLSAISADELFESRGVGRAQIPSTVIGLLVHAAEHTMRHLGQLLVTVKIINLNVSGI